MAKLSSWRKIGSPVILAEKFGKKMIEQKFLSEKDKEIDYVLLGGNDWVAVIALTEEGNVITVKQYKAGCDMIIQELPGGGINTKIEIPDEAIRRELMEETGYVSNQWRYLGACFLNPGSSWTKFHSFLAIECRKIGETSFDENENIIIELVPLQNWIELCYQGGIQDSSSVVTSIRAIPYLGLELVFNRY